MPTPETPITVKSALAELREMFPDEFVEVEIYHRDYDNGEGQKTAERYARVCVGSTLARDATTLDEAMAQVRLWRSRND